MSGRLHAVAQFDDEIIRMYFAAVQSFSLYGGIIEYQAYHICSLMKFIL